MLDIEYRPNRFLGIAFAATFALTATILVWVGIVLRPADRAAMDGLTLLLFTVVPIRFFSWSFAAVFFFFGFRIARRTFTAEPALLVSDAGITLPNRRAIPWAQIASATTNKNDLLVIEVADSRAQRDAPVPRRGWPGRFWAAKPENQVFMSAFDLGADPAAVAVQLENRKAEALGEGAPS